MKRESTNLRRPDLRRSIERDMRRFESREPGQRSFLRSLGVLGSVGWPIVVMMVGGAWLGHWLDHRWETGVRLTLILLFVGTIIGGSVAWSVIQGTGK